MHLKSLVLLCLSTLSIHAFGQIVEVKLASDSWPPFTGMIENQAVASQIVKEALNRNEVAANTKIVGFDNVMTGLKSDQYDGSAALWKNESRDEFLLFSKPYLENQLILVGLFGSDVSMRSLNELKGKKLALVDSYSYGITPDELKGIEVNYGKSDQANLNALLKKEVDYILVDALLIHHLMQSQPIQMAEKLTVGESAIITRSLHFALRKDLEGADALIEQFNKSVDAMKADGTYNRILKVNWIKADVDGDGVLELISTGDGTGRLAPSSSYSMAPNSMPVGDSSQYFIDGKLYKSWGDVPEQYKQAPLKKEDVEEFTFLKFNY